MENRILEVFYGTDGKPYKDQERSVLFPVVGNEYQGANDFTHIRFYYQRLCGEDNTLVAVFKNAKGQLGCKPLSTSTDSTRNEKYALLPISDFLTQYKGDIYIALQCYRGDDDAITWDSDNNMWVLNTQVPTIRSTANIKMSVNYAPLIVGGGEEELITIQVLLSYIAEKSNIDDVVIVVGDISQEDLSGYDEGQLLYDKTTDAYYRKKATSPYYELVNNGKGVLGSSRLLCRLTEDNATIERALSICGSSMFVYNPNGKDYLYFVTEQVSGSTAVAFDIETRRTFIRSGMQDSDTLASVINTTYEADLDLNNVYVKTKGVKIGDIYHTIELISGDLVLGTGSGDILLQPSEYALYVTSRNDYKTTEHEIANIDFVLDHYLPISNESGVLDETAYAYACRSNATIVFKGKDIFRYAYQNNDYIVYRCVSDYKETNMQGFDTYHAEQTLTIAKADKSFLVSSYNFDFYNKTQSEGKFATNFTASLDTTTYVLTFTLKNANGSTLATQTIDLPLESIVTSMTYYDEYTYGGTTYHNVLVIVLATTSVPTIVPVGSLISGLEHEALVEVSDISTPLTASQLALLEYPNAMITYGNNVYLKSEDNGTTITLSVPYISLTTNSGHEEATRKFIVVTKSSGAMALTSDTTSFYNKSQTDTLLGEKADASSVVTDSDIETLGGAVTRIRKGNTWNEVAQEVNMSTTPKVVQSVADLPADNDGYLYVVLDNGYLYSWDEENQEWAQQYQYTSDLLTITEVDIDED